MRLVLFFLCLCTLAVKAQNPFVDKDLNNIIENEKQAYSRLTQIENSADLLTFASTNFDVKYYRCEWEVDPAVRFITGKVTIYYVLTAPANSITLDLMNPLVVDSVKQRTATLIKNQTTNTVAIDFPSQINAGVLDSISIYYKGIPANTGFGSFINSTHAGVPVMWSLSEPYGSRDWWPCKNGLDDKADSIEIIITTPVAYRGASNGMLQAETLIAGGTKRVSHWKHRYPIATYLICIAATNYSVLNETIQLGAINMPFQTHCYPESLTAFQAGTPDTRTAMTLFHDKFGDYPFINEKYGHVQFSWGGGMEHQTASFMTNVAENLMSHELGHQWFGDKVTCGSWEDIWLNEGFATYSTRMYREHKYGAVNPTALTNERRNEINFVTSQPNGSVWVDDTTSVNRIFSNRLSYYKGCYLVQMLRWKLGDVNFFQGIKNYLNDPKVKYGYARTTDLQRNLEQVSGQNLTKFFADWYKGQGYPSYKVSWNMLGNRNVNIKMEQTTSHPSVSFYDLPVPLKFKNATQEQTIVVDNKFNGEEFLRSINFVPDTVLIDPEYWLITRNNSTVKLPAVNFPANTVKIGPNPFSNSISLQLYNVSEPGLTAVLYNALGQRVLTKNITLINGDAITSIPTAHLPKGQYVFKLFGGDVKYVKKMIK